MKFWTYFKSLFRFVEVTRQFFQLLSFNFFLHSEVFLLKGLRVLRPIQAGHRQAQISRKANQLDFGGHEISDSCLVLEF
jgi:hypothetical protein